MLISQPPGDFSLLDRGVTARPHSGFETVGLTRVGQLPAGRPLRARGSRSTQPSQWGLQPFCWVAEGLNPAPALRLMDVAIHTDAPPRVGAAFEPRFW